MYPIRQPDVETGNMGQFVVVNNNQYPWLMLYRAKNEPEQLKVVI